MRVPVTLTALSLIGLLAVAPAPAQPPAPVPPKDLKPSGLSAVPTDSFAFFTLNVSRVLDKPGFKPLLEWFALQEIGPTDELFGLPAEELDRVTYLVPQATRKMKFLVLVTTRKPYNEVQLLKALKADERENRRDPSRLGRAVQIRADDYRIVVLVDDRTLMFLTEPPDDLMFAALLGQFLAKKTDGPLAAALADASKHDFAAAADLRPLARLLERDAAGVEIPYGALLKAHTATVALTFDKTAQLSVKLAFANAGDARRAAPVLEEAGAYLAKEYEGELRRKGLPPAERLVSEYAVGVLKAAKVETNGTTVSATADVPYVEAVAKIAAALPKSYTEFVTNTRAENNLKQLGIAIHAHHDAFGFCPGDVVTFGNKPTAMSWRVQILPFLEQDRLYQQLDMMKPWDDPANLKVLEKVPMPKVFELPGRPAPKGHTYFRMFSLPKNAKGKDRPWLVEGERGPTVAQVTDGLSNTLLIVEAGEAVPWYKPDVLAYDGKLPVPPLGDKATGRFFVALGDGSTRVMQRDKLDEKTLRALITIAGGEVIKLP
jgi:hypothetical protein